MILDRPHCQEQLSRALGRSRVVALLGPRQCGKTTLAKLHGFHMTEIGTRPLDRLWLRGGFPRSILVASDDDSLAWREGFVRTFLERDLPQLGITVPAAAMRWFRTMLAHYHGQVWNASELARSMGLTDKSVRSYVAAASASRSSCRKHHR